MLYFAALSHRIVQAEVTNFIHIEHTFSDTGFVLVQYVHSTGGKICTLGETVKYFLLNSHVIFF